MKQKALINTNKLDEHKTGTNMVITSDHHLKHSKNYWTELTSHNNSKKPNLSTAE